MLNRMMTGFGINPAAGYLLIFAGFAGFSILLFQKIEYAEYIYPLLGASFFPLLSERERNRFLKLLYPESLYFKIRILENLLIVFPFIIVLLTGMNIIPALILLSISVGFVFIETGAVSGFVIPTPFGRKPFEFTVGFRVTLIMILLALFLVVMSVISGNFNLGIASLILIFLVCMSYFLNPENEFFVWIFNQSPGMFLLEKIKTAILYSSMISLPVLLILLVFYFDQMLIIAIFQVLGYIYLIAVILAKYSAYPHQISLPQLVILVFTIWLPPLLIAVIPFFFRQSVHRLKPILG
jgi:hypothetical protein